MEKATIYEYARFTRAHCFVGDECTGCPLHDFRCELENADSEELAKINEIILNWCKEHPIKTRQSEFLKMFPNAKTDSDGIIMILPCSMKKNIIKTTPSTCSYIHGSCNKCRKEYWLAEVE